MNRITIIGSTGAGKTTYLAGMYNQMRRGVSGFTLVADADTDFTLRQYWKAVVNDTSLPTSSFSSFEFSLARNYKRIQTGDFEWLDYAGGILTGPATPELARLKENIKYSDCVLLLLDGEDFNVEAETEEEYIDKVDYNFGDDSNRDATTLDAISKLGEVIAEIEDDDIFIPVVVVVTKADLIPRKWLTSQIHSNEEILSFDIVNRVFEKSNVLTPLRGDPNSTPNRSVMLSAVTLGMDYMNGKIAPLNFGEPIAFSVLCTLHDQFVQLNENKGLLQHNLSKERGKSGWTKFWKGDNTYNYQDLLSTVDAATKSAMTDANKLYALLDGGKKKMLHGGHEIRVADFFQM